jgi:ketosteroid isomerase-like protein
MSRENVELVRRAFRLFRQEGPEAVRELVHPEFELRDPGPIGEVHHGPEGAVEYLREWIGTWDDFAIEAEDFFDAGDQVVIFVVQRGRGRGSGVEVDQRLAVLFRISGGQIIDFRPYPDRVRALEAMRLSE